MCVRLLHQQAVPCNTTHAWQLLKPLVQKQHYHRGQQSTEGACVVFVCLFPCTHASQQTHYPCSKKLTVTKRVTTSQTAKHKTLSGVTPAPCTEPIRTGRTLSRLTPRSAQNPTALPTDLSSSDIPPNAAVSTFRSQQQHLPVPGCWAGGAAGCEAGCFWGLGGHHSRPEWTAGQAQHTQNNCTHNSLRTVCFPDCNSCVNTHNSVSIAAGELELQMHGLPN